VAPAAVVTPKPARPFSRETHYSLLTAEIAGSRQEYDIALSNYVQQAKQTHDPQVAERATMIARYIKDEKTAMEMALLWVEAAPDNSEALANASMTLTLNNRLLEAFDMSRRLLDQGEATLFQNIAASAIHTSDDTREQLLQKYQTLLAIHPMDEQLLVGAGLLLQQQGKYEESLDYAQSALKLNPRSIPAAILDANLLHQLNRDDEAIAKMTSLLEFYPDNVRLRVQYARLLAHQDLGLAQQQFEILAGQAPQDGDILLSLGIIALERKDSPAAASAFERLLDQDQHLSTAHYYLGQLAKERQDTETALIHFLQVDQGNDFISATINVLDILISRGDLLSASEHMMRLRSRFPEQTDSLNQIHAQALIRYQYLRAAEQVLNRALKESPPAANNTNILFARAMLYDKRNNLPAAERDLRAILKLEPDSAAALNALGYILTDRTQRFDEARVLLDKAIALNGDDPAIIDSMGWLYFRTGNYAEALSYLRRAFSLYPDAEIAAHLGEVLWITGAQQEARDVWDKALKLTPDSEVIKSTMQRLKADE
jgi:tetratricopeptide (TPR) repeat protein